MTVALRPYGVQDRADLLRAIDEVCGEGRWMSTARFEPTPAWEHALQTPQCGCHLLLLAVDEDVVAGWCRVFPEANPFPLDASLGIGLRAFYRNRGIGTALVQEALAWAWSAGLPRVTLQTRVDNHRALRVFVRCGFEFLREPVGVWAAMACPRPVLRLPRLQSLATQPMTQPAQFTVAMGSERVWL